ncbi:MAG: hypothetical protein AAGD22_02295 [Verrucomicrobiota bacterium]
MTASLLTHTPIRIQSRRASRIFLLLLLLPLTSIAQVLTTPSNPSPSAPASQTGGNVQKKDTSVLGTDIPLFDAASETFSFDGRTWNVLDNRIFSARFEKYLAAPAQTSEADQEYRDTLDQILAYLSPKNPGGPDLQRAISLLPQAASYYADARLCDSLLNAIYGTYLSQNKAQELNRINTQLDAESGRVRRNYDLQKDNRDRTDRAVNNQDEAGVQDKEREEEKQDPGVLQGYEQRILEIEAQRVANKTRIAASEIQSKVEFQALIVQFFLQRRHEHVVMACRFYRKLFGDGDNKLHFEEESDAQKAFAQSVGFNPTISTLESTSNELIRDVDEGVNAFEYHLGQNQLESASKRLSEAFVVGEYLPKVRTLDRTNKEKVLQFVRDANQLLSTIEVKDYTLAEELINRLRETSKDFDYSKPMAAVQTAKQVASMRIRKAKNAAMAGDTETYEKNIELATEIWPTNPELTKEFNLIADQADIKSTTLNDLDRLIATRSFRQIFDDKGRYIAATVGDAERAAQLDAILNDIAKIDLSINQAEKLTQLGDKHGAWETVEELHQEFSDDPKLSTVRSDLATDVAPFVSALKEAERLEDRNQTGSSLAWYLKARRMYPNSTFAKAGVNRLVELVLPDENTSLASDIAPEDTPDQP